MKSGYTQEADPKKAAEALAQQLAGVGAKAVLFFASKDHDGAALSAELHARCGGAEVIGCTTAGEFTQARHGVGGVSAIALGPEIVRRCAGALAELSADVAGGIEAATGQLSKLLEQDIRTLDGGRYVGFVLVDGLHGQEEEVNERLGNMAPMMSFVGGSAGDDLAFKQTRVFHNGRESKQGAALLVVEAAAPFQVVKTCSFEPSGRTFKATKVDVANRVIYELDGKPVAEVYAQAVGVDAGKLDASVFMEHPVGLVIDGKPWIRSPQQLLPDGGLKFYCQVLEDVQVHLMNPTDLVGDTRRALAETKQKLGGTLRGGLAFNCILRRLEIDARKLDGPFYDSFAGLEVAGFHTYGESWLGHINQTLTAVLF